MGVAEWVDTYGIHHRRILWSSYRKLAWVRFEPTTTEFRSDALTDWAIRPWVQLPLRANFVQLLQFHRLFSVTFHFGYCIYITIYITNKGINNQLQTSWSMTDANRYSSKNICIHQKGQRIPKSLNNKTYLINIQQ